MFVYNLVILFYGLVIKLASLRKLKAKQWIAGRKNWRNSYAEKISKLGNADKIWIHCASYGEFEQGRPLIEAIKKKYPANKIVLTFFSPSGFEAFKNWQGADMICYLPLDTKSNATDFIKMLKPKAAIFIKYEFWLNYLNELKNKNIRTYLVSAVFKPHHPFFKWYGSAFRKSLATFDRLFIQDEKSGKLLSEIGIENFEVSGDTRFDRVVEIKNNHSTLAYFENFCKGNKIIVAGSTWPKDEEILLKAFSQFKNQNVKLILVPHEVGESSIENLELLIQKNDISYLKYSEQKLDNTKKIVIVDTIGLLSKIYFYADVAYIGGGLNEGIHNCLEPAVFLKPVIFYGSDFEKFNEASDLVKMGAAKNIHNQSELSSAINYFLNNSDKQKLENEVEKYFIKQSGTTGKVIDLLNLV